MHPAQHSKYLLFLRILVAANKYRNHRTHKRQSMRSGSPLNRFLFIVLIMAGFISCQQGKNKAETQQVAAMVPDIGAMKISSAVSCTKGLTPGDSTIFMNSGGSAFITTAENKITGDPEKIT